MQRGKGEEAVGDVDLTSIANKTYNSVYPCVCRVVPEFQSFTFHAILRIPWKVGNAALLPLPHMRKLTCKKFN